jgi:methyltransferase (TIGR00027 family)
VFEVDHPDTQARKLEILEDVSAISSAHVTFVAADFNRRDLASIMASTGYRESARTFILWEGVTNYLTEAAVDATLRWCSRARPGSRVLFTYVHQDVLTRPEAFVGTRSLFASLAKAGEALTFGIEPSRLREFLKDRGLPPEQDLGAAEYRERYFGEAARAMRGHEFYRVARRASSGAPGDFDAYPTPPGSIPCSSSFFLSVFRLIPRICAART